MIELGPSDSNPTTATSALFVFTGTDNLTAPAELTFECSLDGAAFEDCQSGDEYLGLSVGPHTFQVRATDPLENVDDSPASRSWTIVAGTTNTSTGTNVAVGLGGGASATFTEVTGRRRHLADAPERHADAPGAVLVRRRASTSTSRRRRPTSATSRSASPTTRARSTSRT